MKKSDDSLNRLPDEIVLQIVNKIIDLKTLCFCKLVSKRFYSVVHQVDAISFTAPCKINRFIPSFHEFMTLNYVDDCKTLMSAIESLSNKFTILKSLNIDWPSSRVDDRFLFMYKIKFCTRINSFLFISPDSFSDTNDIVFNSTKLIMALDCFRHVFERLQILYICTLMFPMLEKVSITDSVVKRGTVSFNIDGGGGKIAELNKPHRMRYCFIPLLKLPVSGYVMTGVTLFLWGSDDLPDGNDNFINVYNFEDDDKEDSAYIEAVTEIFNNYRDQILPLHL